MALESSPEKKTLHPGGHVKSSSARLGPGIDVKADGGYVVAPPSDHVKGKYQWNCHPDETPIDALPNWLLDSL